MIGAARSRNSPASSFAHFSRRPATGPGALYSGALHHPPSPTLHLRQHARHHQRFYVAVAAGLATFGLLRQLAPHLAAMAAGDAFFVVYLGLMAVFGNASGAVPPF